MRCSREWGGVRSSRRPARWRNAYDNFRYCAPQGAYSATGKWRNYLERDSFSAMSLCPASVILLLFIAYPFALGIRMSLSQWFVGQPLSL